MHEYCKHDYETFEVKQANLIEFNLYKSTIFMKQNTQKMRILPKKKSIK